MLLNRNTSTSLVDFNDMKLSINTPIFLVDFNEMLLDGSVVFFSKDDTKKNIFNTEIAVIEGMGAIVYVDDVNNQNDKDRLLSSGHIIKNPIDMHRVKWCCKMNTEVEYELEDGNDILQLLDNLKK